MSEQQQAFATLRGAWLWRATPIGASLIGKSAEGLTLVALATLVPRVLGPADYGVFALAVSIVAIGSSTAALGGPALLSRFVPAAPAGEREGVALALAVRLARVRVAQVGVFTAVAELLAALAPHRFPLSLVLLVVLAFALDVAATLGFQLALG